MMNEEPRDTDKLRTCPTGIIAKVLGQLLGLLGCQGADADLAALRPEAEAAVNRADIDRRSDANFRRVGVEGCVELRLDSDGRLHLRRLCLLHGAAPVLKRGFPCWRVGLVSDI